MIRSKREYQATLDQLVRLESTLAALANRPTAAGVPAEAIEAESGGVLLVIRDLRGQLLEYESRQSADSLTPAGVG